MGPVVKKAPVILIYPPVVSGNYRKIYPSLPVLAASLRTGGYSSIQLDLNNLFFDWYLRSTSYRSEIAKIKRKISRLEEREIVSGSEYNKYVGWKQMALYDNILRRNLKDPTCVTDAIFDSIFADRAIFDFSAKNRADHINTSKLLTQFYNDFFRKNRFIKPLFIGISVSMALQIMPTILLIKYLKKRFGQNIHIYCGGSALTLASHRTLKNIIMNGLVDGIVSGEGEEAIAEIARQSGLPHFNAHKIPNYVFMSSSDIIKSPTTPHRSINEYPAPLYDKKELKKWNRTVLTTVISRRCYWGRCAYCNYQSLYLRKQVKEVEKAVNEIETLTKRYDIRDVALACDTVEPDYVRKLCRLMIKRSLDVGWQCYLRIDNRYSLSDLKLMERSGCELVAVGLESLSTKTLNLINKGYTSEEAVSFLRKLLKTGMGAQINMIPDLPGTNYESAKKQYSILRNLLMTATKKEAQRRVAHFRLSIDQKMPMGRKPHKYGIQLRTDGCVSRQYRMSDELAFFDPKGMTVKQKQSIEKMYDELNEKLLKAKHYRLTDNRKIGKHDILFINNKTISFVDFTFEEDENNGRHRKTDVPHALAYNCESDIFSTIHERNIFRRFIALLPMKFAELEKKIVGKKALGKKLNKKEFNLLIKEARSQGLIDISH